MDVKELKIATYAENIRAELGEGYGSGFAYVIGSAEIDGNSYLLLAQLGELAESGVGDVQLFMCCGYVKGDLVSLDLSADTILSYLGTPVQSAVDRLTGVTLPYVGELGDVVMQAVLDTRNVHNADNTISLVSLNRSFDVSM